VLEEEKALHGKTFSRERVSSIRPMGLFNFSRSHSHTITFCFLSDFDSLSLSLSTKKRERRGVEGIRSLNGPDNSHFRERNYTVKITTWMGHNHFSHTRGRHTDSRYEN
jgi:hypothetical protein